MVMANEAIVSKATSLRSKFITDTIVMGNIGHAIDQKKPCIFVALKYEKRYYPV
jgi:hypothetical protein